MPTSPVANLEERLVTYRRQCIKLYTVTLPVIFLAAFVFVAGLLYVARGFGLGLPLGILPTAVLMGAAAGAISWVLLRQPRPTEADVELDRALRRAFGKDAG